MDDLILSLILKAEKIEADSDRNISLLGHANRNLRAAKQLHKEYKFVMCGESLRIAGYYFEEMKQIELSTECLQLSEVVS